MNHKKKITKFDYIDGVNIKMNLTKKYKLTNYTIMFEGRKLYRIRRLSDGLLGGWVESERNLDQNGECFIFGDAIVFGNARVYENAYIYGNAQIFGDAKIYGDAKVYEHAKVYDNARIFGEAEVFGYSRINNRADICGNTKIKNNLILDTGCYYLGDIEEEYLNYEVFTSSNFETITALLTKNGWKFNWSEYKLLTKEQFLDKIKNLDDEKWYLKILSLY